MARRSVEIEVEILVGAKPKSRAKKKPRKSNANDGADRPRNSTRNRKAPTPKVALVGKRRWARKVDVCGQRYDVKVDDAYDSRKWEGACTWSDNLIEILVQAEDRMHDALIHELVHAINDASGLKWEIANRFKKKLSLQDRRDLDELMCRHLAPAILQVFRNAGWLKLPKWPPR